MTPPNNTKLNNQKISQALRLFFISTYLVLLFLVASTIDFHLIFAENKTSFVFLCAAFVLYGLLYLIPALLLTKITKKGLSSQLAKPYAQATVYAVAVFAHGRRRDSGVRCRQSPVRGQLISLHA